MANILDEIFGQKPQVAQFKQQPLGQAQLQSLAGNIGAFGDITQLGELYTKYMTDQQNALLPGYSQTLALGEQGAQDILKQGESLVEGQIPQDVIDAVQRNSAYGAMEGGFAGSGMSRALTARDLGLTSLDLMSRGASMIGQGGNSAQQWAALARGDIYDPNQSLTTPGQQEAANMQNAILQQQSRQMEFNVAAAPDPVVSGIFNDVLGGLGMVAGKYAQGAGMSSGLGQPQQAGTGGGGGGGL